MWFGGPNHVPPGDMASTRKGNDGIIALAASKPGLIPIVTVHPYDGEAALRELERVRKRGAKVLKIHSHTQRFDAADPRVLALVRKAGDLGMVVLMDNASIVPGDNQKLLNIALETPKTNFIFAHIGGLDFRFWNILKLARTAENLVGNNIYFDASTAPLMADSPLEAEFVWTLRNVGIDYVLFGSDYPQLSVKDSLDALNRLGLTDEELAKIRYGNAKRLFGL
ncbi:amidohydrolase family protein [Sphingomonas piscis]|uniref:Amidohydrolase family protein n=2 Tax=Sphingomonas piscis TaxID=2714943 RepID=A0A6G7YT95_9SPHN|nr:amidohydrolase family protein [Sphingomonas piscis]